MNTRTHACIVVLTLLCILALLGCQRRPVADPISANMALAIVGFTQPKTDNAALAGYVPHGSEEVKAKTLATLDAALLNTLSTESKRTYASPAQTRRCMSMTDMQTPTSRHGALDYYIQVGQCMEADYLLVPQLLFWREREGGPAGVTQPASVMIDMYVLDIKEQGVAARYRFDETQVSLADNMLTLDKFVDRGGKWLTASELAEWGVNDGLRILGLK